MDMAQDRLLEAAGLQVQKMALGDAKEQGAALMKLMDSASVITDPAMGNKIDILA
ncbi:YjfB family protein [Breznakiella homolactica]|uniref:YjfB family protein n=2 Tax=Breznakiella homolactica TaxID=2798577 RepID=A0A7T8B998_9SPIR|nr:YjfB family protein [Breznakiella homolactica]